MPADSSRPRQPGLATTRLLLAYALANIAVVVAYLPLLLPLKIAAAIHAARRPLEIVVAVAMWQVAHSTRWSRRCSR